MHPMKSVLLSGLLSVSSGLFADPVGSAFTYQGELQQLGNPATGAYDFQFDVYAVETDGAPLTSPIQLEDVIVSNGIFTVALDFGLDPFTGEQLWLEIGVREGLSQGDYSLLAPRQALNPVPYAIQALSVAPGSVTLDSLAVACQPGETLVMGSGGWGCCNPPLIELCDGLDNDCDGGVDETFTSLGSLCGQGVCSGGVTICAPGGETTLCSTGPGGPDDQSAAEVCDNIDNDCDGDVDETFTGLGLICGEGQCAGGLAICAPGGETTLCSTGPGGPDDQSAPEACDNIDNDCDGDVDEDVSRACYTGPLAPRVWVNVLPVCSPVARASGESVQGM